MNFRLQAESDLGMTLQDGISGFGLPVIIEDNTSHIIGDDVDNPFYCQLGRINFLLDPDTGVQIEGDWAHVTARIKDLLAAGFDVDKGSKMWKLTVPDINQQNGGKIRSYKVKIPRVDHTLGITTLICSVLNRENTANEAIINTIMGALNAT